MTVVSVIGEGCAHVQHVTGERRGERLNETAKKGAKLSLIYKDCKFGKGNTQNNPCYEMINDQNQSSRKGSQETSEVDNQEVVGD